MYSGKAERAWCDNKKPCWLNTRLTVLCRLSTNWMKRLCITCEQMIHQDGAHHGVRIAILDSGIDINHPDIIAREERIRDVRSWVNGLNGESAWKDGDILGHGTHTTSLLLDCAPQHAGIYVARVASTDLSDASQIAKVCSCF